jgi:hypothetical protein
MTAPNIIVIMTGQQRYDTLGVNGNEIIRTPNIDALAQTPYPHGDWLAPVCMRRRLAMARTITHKLVQYAHADGEFYDVSKDPAETINRFSDPANAAVKNELMARLLDWLIDTAPVAPPFRSAADAWDPRYV